MHLPVPLVRPVRHRDFKAGDREFFVGAAGAAVVGGLGLLVAGTLHDEVAGQPVAGPPLERLRERPNAAGALEHIPHLDPIHLPLTQHQPVTGGDVVARVVLKSAFRRRWADQHATGVADPPAEHHRNRLADHHRPLRHIEGVGTGRGLSRQRRADLPLLIRQQLERIQAQDAHQSLQIAPTRRLVNMRGGICAPIGLRLVPSSIVRLSITPPAPTTSPT